MILDMLENPLTNRILMKKIKVREAYGFWDHHCHGFSRPFRDLTASDVTPKIKQKLPAVLSKNLTSKKNRFCTKLTGWPRIGFLNEIFPDAKFIHIVRDGRAVTNSLINIGFWWGWQGPENWRWGQLPQDYAEEWNKYNQSFIALAAIEWKMIMDAFEVAKQQVPGDRYIEIKYEELCENPLEVYRRAMDFAELPWTKKFENQILSTSLVNSNSKWIKEFNSSQKDMLNDMLAGHLSKFNYTV